ncbi:hypothetical protein CSIM01_04832 [Colletotrichum simmondsii]|uniref:Ecp2 effector protein domain-containing protein n=1 Tax=Colletotrichum simmondsii TaxID=703756 RepID=A0A135TJT6_9PEZI|nr:hypothetical protein CSIM01_04832 [Colletotrichum simmondsii]
MVKFVLAAGLLALVPFIAAAPTAAEATEQNLPFSFERWAEDIIANPNGQHPSPEEAMALAFNQTSSEAFVADAVWCIDFIAARANVQCKAVVSATVFCHRGQAQIAGVATGGNPPRDTSSPCGNVARSAGQIMDACTRGSLVFGQNNAWGNGNMRVHIRR